MMKSSLITIYTALGLVSVYCCFFQLKIVSGSVVNQKQTGLSQARPVAGSTPVGKIGDSIITRQELMQRLLLELQPDSYRIYTSQTKPLDANSMLLLMLGEKALIADARKQGLLNDEQAQKAINTYKQQQIINLWVSNNITKEKDKIAATKDEIDKQIKANSKMDREKAKDSVQSAKANKILDQIYEDLYKKSDVKKLKENFQKAIEIHDRLLNHPAKPDNMKIIREFQIKDELTQQEKNIVLATFNRGKITLKDWFETLCGYSPPSRPQNLNTDIGIEQILDSALTKQIIVSDAQNLGLDKDAIFAKQINEYENSILLNNLRNKKYQEIKEPALEDMIAFYNNSKEYFTTDRVLIIDQIWCKDLETAKRVKSALNSGKNFDELKKEYSLFPEGQAYNAYPGNEGFFWNALWSGEPNDIIGPIKGFQTDSIKWRIVKIIEKQPGKQQPFSKDIENNIKILFMSQQGNKIFADTCLETLKKYPYEIYSDKIKDIDLMNSQ